MWNEALWEAMKRCQLLCEICGDLLGETYMSEIDGN